MFTGLIQEIGTVEEITNSENSARLVINAPSSSLLVQVGDSIAVNGVCLTITHHSESQFSVDVMVQTLSLTNLGDLKTGDEVNLELSARATTFMGGHIVQGHIDGVAQVVSRTPGENWEEFVIKVPKKLTKYIVNQGSLAVDGVSLTVGTISEESDEVTLWLIPETLRKTNLSKRDSGDWVNIEVDILAKYIEKLLMKQIKHD